LDNELLQALVRSIVAAVRPEKVVLFGSFARGDAGPDSDVDLFVQVDPGRDPGEVTTAAYAAIRPLRARLRRGVDIVVKERSFVERYGDLVGTVVRPVLREGKVLYAA
jgi:predicted nucleotidyltransferase